MNLPKELLYSREHEWVRKLDGNKVRIGITDFAQDQLGDIVFVELPEVGAELAVDESFGSVESVKTVSELYAPVSGKVLEVNEALEESPENVNDSPYEDGWMIVVEMTDPAELEKLMDAGKYEAIVSEED
ncbi:glycine cleavage system protein GcvH [Thermoactinomyces mirandus]|uniref:Glycine cleavage system H protein n=1 Tax=Thermoactinomyces mirandus TaxID=2756294 RepID=A0A7W1XTM3_9BACL|nr:glycine cleavage system protein GcvH [Thermoactinomyces mirandus]MBA4603024.1 glycine cleavage system protein GcvH [Thermoactinomyces mirandus]